MKFCPAACWPPDVGLGTTRARATADQRFGEFSRSFASNVAETVLVTDGVRRCGILSDLMHSRWRKIRLSFSHMDIPYDFAVTDPFIRGRLERQGTDGFELELPWVCVSLAPAFRGDHYKVVATVIE